jgi:hypothetical protein
MLMVMATAIAPAAIDDYIALVALMAADGVGIAVAVVFAELQFGEHLLGSLQL